MSVENRLITSKLLKQEEVIERGYIDCGKALAIIRDEELYKVDYDSFEQYVKVRWDYSKSRAYQLIEASTIVDALPPEHRPKNESQAREITKAPPEKQAEVAKSVADKCKQEERQPTAKDYKQAVEQATAQKCEPEPVYADMDDDDETVGGDEPPKAIELSTLAENLIPELMSRFQDVTNLKKKLKAASVQTGGEWLQLELNEINEQLSQVQYKIKMAKFAAICPKCRNDKKAKQTCVVCRTYGWIAESRVEFAKNYGAA